MDPLDYTEGTGKFVRGEVRGEVTISNSTVKGLKQNSFTNARANLVNNIFRLELDYVVPHLLLEGYVTAQGSLGPFRMSGKGVSMCIYIIINILLILLNLVYTRYVKKIYILFYLFMSLLSQ